MYAKEGKPRFYAVQMKRLCAVIVMQISMLQTSLLPDTKEFLSTVPLYPLVTSVRKSQDTSSAWRIGQFFAGSVMSEFTQPHRTYPIITGSSLLAFGSVLNNALRPSSVTITAEEAVTSFTIIIVVVTSMSLLPTPSTATARMTTEKGTVIIRLPARSCRRRHSIRRYASKVSGNGVIFSAVRSLNSAMKGFPILGFLLSPTIIDPLLSLSFSSIIQIRKNKLFQDRTLSRS